MDNISYMMVPIQQRSHYFTNQQVSFLIYSPFLIGEFLGILGKSIVTILGILSRSIFGAKFSETYDVNASTDIVYSLNQDWVNFPGLDATKES